ncbi:MAG TPA: glycerol-3-phosphate acyltransferase, partial [Oscillospiraceae bacterium]|nr:glycerol-3-phosphate acyltransferase [Oscillospiraceae bacterium]
MDNWTSFLLAAFCTAALSYLLGSCNMAIIVSRLFRVPDIREFGSGSAGMTNMLRTYGKKLAAITFAGDFLKGSLAVFLARVIFARMGFAMDLGYLAGIFVVLGHIFPIFFGFHGGKGVAT